MQTLKRIVVKVGTSTLTYETGKTNLRRMMKLCAVLADLHNAGLDVALVTSGAIGVGVGKLGLGEKPQDIPGRQAAACVGQCELMFMYDKFFGEYGQKVGQMLVTKADFENAERRENLSNTFEKLFEYGAIPVINENDSVATEEIVYGDNDSLSAVVASLVGADLLVILSDIDGLHTADPRTDPDARLISEVPVIDDCIRALAGGSGSQLGTGGMATKVHAAELTCAKGIDLVIAQGAKPALLYDIAEGKPVGTRFISGGHAHDNP